MLKTRKDKALALSLLLYAFSPKAVNASKEFLGQRDDDARGASHIAESVLVLVLDHLADEFGAVGAQASDSVVDAFDERYADLAWLESVSHYCQNKPEDSSQLPPKH